jgi:hypothetical protein
VRVLAVDWSGDARTPQRRIRLAEAEPGRLLAVWGGLDREGVVDLVVGLAATGPLVVGLDFSFALPAWFAREHGCRDVEELWALVARDGEDWLRRCPPPFWGRPGTRRPPDDPERPLLRRTEAASPHRPLSTFQIGGAGAVGTGSLRGMPLLTRLRAAGVAVWPFDDAARATVVEIYPRETTGAVVKSDATARRDRVAADGRIPAVMRGAASASEDAFDAAFAALALAEHAGEIAGLRRGTGDDLLEGRIWRPVRCPHVSRDR